MKSSFLFLFLLASGTVAAQTQKTRVGIKAGGTLSSYVGEDVDASSSSKLGIHGGVVFDLGVNERFSIQPEVLYSMKGIKEGLNGTNGSVTGYQTLQYLDVPVLVKAKFNKFFLEAGPQAGVLLNAKLWVEEGPNSFSRTNKSEFKDVDFGYAVGLGFQAESGVLAGLRYNGGFTDVTKPATVRGQTFQLQGRNSAFQFYVGYLFGSK